MKLLEWILYTDVNSMTGSPEKRKQIRETLRRLNQKNPGTTRELYDVQKILLTALPGVDPRLILPVVNDNSPLQSFPFTMELPAVFDGYSQFYKMIIYNQCLGIYNRFITESRKTGSNGSRLAETLLSKIETLAYNASERICESSLPSTDHGSKLQDFVLVSGQRLVTILYFSIQELYADQLTRPVDPQEFYFLILDQSIDKIQEIKRVMDSCSPAEKGITCDSTEDALFCFGYTGEEKKLKNALFQLDKEVEFLDPSCKWTRLFEALTSKGFKPGSIRIDIKCYIYELRYILEALQGRFNGLLLADVGRSMVFYKNGKVVSAEKLYQTTKNSIKKRKRDKIDAILKQLY